MQDHEQKRRGYRPKSLTGRDNYGLTATELVGYLRARGRPVSKQLDRAYCQEMDARYPAAWIRLVAR